MTENNLILDCQRIVVEIVGSKNALKWWLSPINALNGKTPKEVASENPVLVYDFLVSVIQNNH